MFDRALKRKKRKTYLWEAMNSVFSLSIIDNRETFYRLLSEPRKTIEGRDVVAEP